MTEGVVLRVVRPYANEDEYISAEAWCIDDKTILLVDQPPLPRDALVRFEVVLEDGSRPIRAEGKVMRMVAATATRPGGLKVRFRRFGASTKVFLERVMAARRKERRMSKRPQPQVLEDAAADEAVPQPAKIESEPAPVAVSERVPLREDSGVHTRSGEPVPPPPNREELLERLRERSRHSSKLEPPRKDDGTG